METTHKERKVQHRPGAAGGHAGRSHTLRTSAVKHGQPIGVRIALLTSAAIAMVMGFGGILIYSTTTQALVEEIKASGVGAAKNLSVWPVEWEPIEREDSRGETKIQRVKYKVGGVTQTGLLYREPIEDAEGRVVSLADVLIPEERLDKLRADLLLLIFSITVVLVMAAALIAWFIGNKVTGPLTQLISDIEIISRGDLDHKTRVREGGETGMLARSVDRMTEELKLAQETELELQKREHDLAIATEVRQNLLPEQLVQVTGYEISGEHKASAEVGGDYYDVIPIGDTGKIAILVAEVAGKGISAALIMTMARAYLRSELQRDQSLVQAFAATNRALNRDMRRGMFVTALCILLDTHSHQVTAVSAGHKLPLLRWTWEDKQLRSVTPPGIALGFDKGPVFEKTLKENEVILQPGDRLLLSTSAPLGMRDKAGEELGEKGFYALLKKHAAKDNQEFFKSVLADIEHFLDGQALASDLAMVTVRRA